jgi:hypothetical protein
MLTKGEVLMPKTVYHREPAESKVLNGSGTGLFPEAESHTSLEADI